MAKPTPRTTEADVTAAVEAVVRAKRSFRAVAKEWGVSHVQVRRWVMAWKIANPGWDGVTGAAEPEPEPPSAPWTGLTKVLTDTAAPPPPAELEPVPDLGGDALEIMKANTAQDMARVRELRRMGNHELAQRAARDVAKSVEAIARLEAARPKSEGDIVFNREEYLATEAELQELISKHVQGRPLLCADCGRKLAIKWGNGEGGSEPGPA